MSVEKKRLSFEASIKLPKDFNEAIQKLIDIRDSISEDCDEISCHVEDYHDCYDGEQFIITYSRLETDDEFLQRSIQEARNEEHLKTMLRGRINHAVDKWGVDFVSEILKEKVGE